VRGLAIAGMVLFISACAISPVSVLKGQGSWSSFQHAENGRSEATAVVLHDGSVLLVGGNLSNGSPVSTTEIYDPRHGSWSTASDMPVAVNIPTATVMADGRVLVVGGEANPNTGVAVNTAFIFDPASGIWTKVAPMEQSRYGQSDVLLANGRVLVTGGYTSSTQSTSSTEIFDPATGKWTKAADMPAKRESAVAIVLPDGRVVVAGGYSPPRPSGGRLLPPPATLYDPIKNVWSNLKFPPTGYYVNSAFLSRSGQLVGFIIPNSGGVVPFVFDLQSGVTRTGATMPVESADTQSSGFAPGDTLLQDGRLLTSDGSRALLYDPAGNTWSVAPTPPNISVFGQSATGETSILLNNGRVLVVGGDTFDLFDPNGVVVGPSPAFIGSAELSWWLTVIAALMILFVGAQHAWSRRPQHVT